jgi:hypothetical protein
LTIEELVRAIRKQVASTSDGWAILQNCLVQRGGRVRGYDQHARSITVTGEDARGDRQPRADQTGFDQVIIRCVRCRTLYIVADTFPSPYCICGSCSSGTTVIAGGSMLIEKYEIRPYGIQLIRVWGAVVNGEPKVAAEVCDNIILSCVSLSAKDAVRFAKQIMDACEAAVRAADDLAGHSTAEAQRAAGLRTQAKPGEPGYKVKP